MHEVGVASHGITFVPSFVKIGQGVKQFEGTHTHTHTHRQVGDQIRLLCFLIERKEKKNELTSCQRVCLHMTQFVDQHIQNCEYL
jgi:hypothetical protein